MCYLKLFIDISKKQVKTEINGFNPKAEKSIAEIFKEPLEDLFDKPELVKQNFESYYNYSLEYFNGLENNGIKPGLEHVNEVLNLLIQTDKNNEEDEYYKKLFLLEFLGSKIDQG
jgi:hypothetical protein